MKNILLSLIAIFITLGFSGCAPQFLNGVSPQGKDYNSAIITPLKNKHKLIN